MTTLPADPLSTELRKLREEIAVLRDELAFVRTHLSSYLGNGVALTHLVDETPIFINANDFGGPSNLINGGRYEEDNLAVLMSFVRDDTVFLDIGANLGIFSLQVARRVGGTGKVHAFEPHPLLQDLLWRSAFLNGLRYTIELHRFGLSDQNADVQFAYPNGHLGGGALHSGAADDAHLISAKVKRLDDVFGSDFSCDVVKIDVEGHELQVMRGMSRILANSPDIKIVFENLGPDIQTRNAIERFLSAAGLALYAIEANASLRLLPPGEFDRFVGYVLATRRENVGDLLRRARFSIYPRQLFHATETLRELSKDRLRAGGITGQLLFHGPYWFLPRGVWRLKLHGSIRDNVALMIATRFGHKVAAFTLSEGETEGTFVSEHDLVHFECAGRALTDGCEISIERLELIREA